MIGWTTGERLHTRGHAWTVLGSDRGIDCTALHLARELEPAVTSTLLSPFDRFITTERGERLQIVRPRRWTEAVKVLAATSHPSGSLRCLPTAKIELLPHQLEPALAVFRLGATRLLIADMVGLGKTIQAGLIAAELTARMHSTRALILVPAGLRDQWAGELARHFALECIRADASWLAAAVAERSIGLNPWALPGLFLASFDFVKRAEVLRPLEDVTWDLLVVDEVHAASTSSDRRAAVHAIAIRARIVVLLTATPPADNPAEYESLCNIGRIDARERPMLLFRRSQADIGIRARRKSTLLMVRPSEAEVRMHELLEEYTNRVWHDSNGRGDNLARLAAIVLRKRALSSAAALALSVRRRIDLLVSPPPPDAVQLRLPIGDEDPLEDDEPAAVLAAPGLASASLERRWLSLIAEAAQRAATAETKLRFLERTLARVHEPVIVFTEYRDTLLRLKEVLTHGTRIVSVLHGGMRPSERTAVQEEFNRPLPDRNGTQAGRRVLLATDAAAEGLNLHERCRSVIHFELPWSTSRLEQRAGRVDRLGQRLPVHEVALVSATSAERLVLAPLMRRASRALATGFAAEGLPAALAESQVADLIFGNGSPRVAEASPSSAPIQSNLVRTASLRSEAIEEVNRIRGMARLSAGCACVFRPRRALAAVVTRRRSTLPIGTILIYLIELSSKEAQLHGEPVALWLPHALDEDTTAHSHVSRFRRAANISAVLDRLRARSTACALEALRPRIRSALEHTARVYDAVNQEWRQRNELMLRASRSTATQLVQQGLFERRTKRAAAVTDSGMLLADDGHTAPVSATVVAVEARLVAALLVLR